MVCSQYAEQSVEGSLCRTSLITKGRPLLFQKGGPANKASTARIKIDPNGREAS
jgi:hypothetical protein